MGIYVFIEAILGIIAGILLALFTKKADGITYGQLDEAGVIMNSVFLPLYAVATPACIILGLLCRPNHDGFLGIIGWIVSVIAASAPLLCGLGLGASVALRKRGKSKLGFAIQFLGVVAIALTFVFFFSFYGNLLAPLKYPGH